MSEKDKKSKQTPEENAAAEQPVEDTRLPLAKRQPKREQARPERPAPDKIEPAQGLPDITALAHCRPSYSNIYCPVYNL